MDLSIDLSNIKALFTVIQPLPGLGSSSYHFHHTFLIYYSHLNPSDLGDCFILGYFEDNHI